MAASSTAIPYPNPTLRPAAVFGFALVHVCALGAFVSGFSWEGLLLCIGSYYLRIFGVTAGYHRYFSHRAFKLNRFWQFCLAFLAQTSAQKGVLWWASLHRHHHRFSDTPQDIHSPTLRGFWWSHMGWILARDYEETDISRIQDMAKFPELRWLDRNQYLPTMLYAITLYLLFDWNGIFWGYFLSTVLVWHGTFTINSVMHVFGKKVFPTPDTSRNSFLFAILTMGEGWHNNHHYYPGSAPQGFLWWQFDPTYYTLWLGEKLRIVKGLRRVPERIREMANGAILANVKIGDAVSEAVSNAIGAAGDHLGERIDRLSLEWEGMRSRIKTSALQKLADLEASRQAGMTHLEELQSDYAQAVSRAGAAAEKRIEEIRAEMEKTKSQLADTLEKLVETARTLSECQTA